MSNRDEATAFIAALAGAPNAKVLWQTLDDDKQGHKRFGLTRNVALDDDWWAEFASQNALGYGVFLMVNEGDGSGKRDADHVAALRALFVDDDKGLLDPDSSTFASCPPSIVTHGRRGPHLYWLLEPGEPLEAFTPAQEHLALALGTDGTVKDLPRIMRVPGFHNMKDPSMPYPVRLGAVRSVRYRIADVVAAFPLPEGITVPVPRPTPPQKRRGKVGPRPGMHGPRGEAERVLAQFPKLEIVKWAVGNPGDLGREAWRGLATNIAAAVLDEEEAHDAGLELFDVISQPDDDRYSRAACERVFADALNSARNFGPMTWDALIAAGVPESVCGARKHGKAPVAIARLLALRARRSE